MDFFKSYQEITQEQFSKLTLTNEKQTKQSKKYTTLLNNKKYFVLIYKDKYFISRKPISVDLSKWMPIGHFQGISNYKHEMSDQLTSTGNKMFTLTKDEVQYVGFIDDEGQEYVSTTNKIII